MNKNKRYLCVGHSTYDTTIPVNEYPKENIKHRVEYKIECGGGPAANGAYLLAKWGMDVTICSIIGDDYYGEQITKEFKEIGADVTYLEKRKDYHTSSSYIIANMSNGSRTILTTKKEKIRKLSKEVNEKADVILIDGEHPETASEVLDKNPNAISVIDAGRLNDDTKYLGKKVTYVVCSKDYAEEFTNQKIGEINLDQLMNIHKQLEDYFQTNIIITLEGNGSFTKIDNIYQIIPTIKVRALDSTGAGDIFHGAFTYFIGNDYSLKEAIRMASITAAISVTRVGARYSIPMLSEVLGYDNAI